jgi:hypothetical protein
VDQDRFIELAPDYALGLLEGDDLEQFERHLASGCESCEIEVARMDSVGDALAYAVPLVPAPEGLRERVLLAVEAELASTRQEQAAPVPPKSAPRPAASQAPAPSARPADGPHPTYSPGPWPPDRPGAAAPAPPKSRGFLGGLAPALAFAGVLLSLLSGAYALQLRQQLAFVKADLERVQAENQELARVMDVVGSPRLRVIALGGQASSPKSEGRVLWSPDAKKAVFYANGLPRPPAGKDYQLWVIEGSTPRSEGVFPVGDDGKAQHVLPEVPAPGGVGAFAVTLEPAGGLSAPSGPMYLLGAVSDRVN